MNGVACADCSPRDGHQRAEQRRPATASADAPPPRRARADRAGCAPRRRCSARSRATPRRDDHEREQDAERVARRRGCAASPRSWISMPSSLNAPASTDDHPERHGRRRARADHGRGAEVVGQPLEDEHLHQVARGACRPHARCPARRGARPRASRRSGRSAGSPAAIEKLPNVVKSDMNDVALRSAASSPSCLTALELEAERRERGAEPRARRRRSAARPSVSSPRLETRTWLDARPAPEQRLGRASGSSAPAPSVPGAVEVDDRRDARIGAGRPRGKHAHAVAGTRAELVAPRRGPGRPRRGPASASETRRAVACRGSRRSPPCRAGSAANSPTRGSVCRVRRSCTATGSMIAGATPSTCPVARSAAIDGRGVALVEVARPASAAPVSIALDVGAAAPTRARRSARATRSTDERIVRLIVSPVTSADAMIVVPSISPTTISAARPRRRATLRRPSRRSTRLRSASVATTPSAARPRAR